MFKITHVAAVTAMLLAAPSFASGGGDDKPDDKHPRHHKLRYLKEAPNLYEDKEMAPDSVPFEPSIHVGSIVHMYGSADQRGFGPGGASLDDNASKWDHSFSIYRARILVGGQLSEKGSFFLETELPAPPTLIGSSAKNMGVTPRILDAQYEHKFHNSFQIIAGLILTSHNRNGLQGAAALMANDFTYFQYPYNMFESSPLQGFLGRDVGIATRGFLLDDQFEYRLGLYSGRRTSNDAAPGFDSQAPFRVVGRFVYNFLEPEKAYYYSGTNLGKGETVALAAGFDTQASYANVGSDLFVDVPIGDAGSVTLNSAFTYMSGGTKDPMDYKYSFANMIPKQTITHIELGYYFKDVKLQPWIRYENQAINADEEQTGGADVDDFNTAGSSMVLGGGLNYFFNDYGTNLRLSYTTFNNEVMNGEGEFESTSFGSFWCQLQFFIF